MRINILEELFFELLVTFSIVVQLILEKIKHILLFDPFMRGIFLFFMLMVAGYADGYSQSLITGRVVDATDKAKLENATVMLLQARDSALIAYVRADATGQFQLKKPASGEYLIVISYPKYADFYEELKGGTGASNLGDLGLTSVAHLIEEVVVKRRAAITVKGDTTEYDASQFKMEKNAKVEDLLKALPGITVDASGKITAQGKTVKKVLVDGEEFFGNDPTLVTRNLRSDMVDKVQVYEKKSDQAERTGVDDGVREQTINVQLKDDAKNGIFGKALAGGGTDKYYMGQLMLNKFKGSQKISAYGLFGNNGTTSMNWDDAQKYGIEVDASFDGGTMVVNDPFSGQGVVGIPRAINTGVNFTDRWKKDKYQINLNYKYGKISSDGTEETIMSGIVNSNTEKTVDTDNDQHRINLRLNTNIDSLNEVLIKASATKKKLWSNTITESNNFTDGVTTNNSNEYVDNDVNSYDFDVLYTKRFLKKGRSLSLNAVGSKSETEGTGTLRSTLSTGSTGAKLETDQSKDTRQDVNKLQGQVTYTEPLSKLLNLSLGYQIVNVTNSSLLESRNKDATGDYTIVDEKFSSNYDFNRLSNNYDVALGYNSEKLKANLTNTFNDDRLNQINNYNGKSLKRDFFTYNPRLTMTYNFSMAKALRLSYSGRNQLPSLNQIQPIMNNSDPLNQYEGNENLNPSFINTVEGFYHSFNLLSNQFKYIGGTVNLTKDPISQNITTTKDDDDNVINYYRWDNMNGKKDFNAAMYGGYHFRLNKALVLDNSFGLVFNVGENNNFFNSEANLVKSQSYTFSYEIKRETKTGLNFQTKLSPQYRQMKSNLSPDQDNNGFVMGVSGGLEYFFSSLFKIYTNYDYSYEAPTAAFDQKLERFLVHPGISKKFLKNESLMLDFTVNDVFNKNIGYSRAQSNSVFTQRRYDTIRRYYMLKVSWDFTKMFVK
ncbi:Carboxypeptidase regulatory-like domain-containing protein [Sphingobacterium nematocida]|uniref:Carboxypeptidase regulatory-like domain-containing protein n=2 Tax=Sphingobacterium nematocida TaxID=1513896 RepID=A0A1T5BG35_9SPHI|nr:Carboxypeptidase regulatory-like domain-containing protein [Sphingobacterium nematocida]